MIFKGASAEFIPYLSTEENAAEALLCFISLTVYAVSHTAGNTALWYDMQTAGRNRPTTDQQEIDRSCDRLFGKYQGQFTSQENWKCLLYGGLQRHL